MSLFSFSGVASGIDSASLIKSILDQQRAARITPLENQIAQRQDTNSSFSKLRDLLDALKDSVQPFRALSGGAVAKTAQSADETVVTAQAQSSAQSGTYTVTVAARASTATFSFDDRFAAPTSALNAGINDATPEADRTVSFSVGTGGDAENIAVVLDSTTTAQQFVSAFNAQSSKAAASLVNTGTSASPSYAIVINSNTEGTAAGSITLDSLGSELAAGSSVFQSNTLSQASDASLTISGIDGVITRSSNTVSDVLSGVTLSLNSLGTSSVVVSGDRTQTAKLFQSFVDSFNEIIDYAHEQDQVTTEQDGAETSNTFGPLAGTSLDENALSLLRSAMSQAGLTGHTVNVLADLGITTQRDGSLAFDEDTFNEAFSNDLQSIETIAANLGESLGAVDGTIAQYTRFNGLIDTATQSNNDSITDMQKRITDIEKSLSQQESMLTARYARLESVVGGMNSQQSALSSLLSSL